MIFESARFLKLLEIRSETNQFYQLDGFNKVSHVMIEISILNVRLE